MIAEDLAAFRVRCEDAGLDVVWPFRVQWFNGEVEPKLRLPDFGRDDALGVVIANTSKLWSPFVETLRRDPGPTWPEHPLDTYVEHALDHAVRDCIAPRSVLFFGHHVDPAPIAIQRIAAAGGLAHLSPSHLSIHPQFGPWIALRAVLVVDTEGPTGERPRAPDPCAGCDRPCLSALDRALAKSAHDVAPHWEAWAEVRRVCPEGLAFRYDEQQLRYHYTKDRSILRKLVR